jgi:adenosylmethionine-8-amino-7-oxononanoate aminotransferase
MCAGGMIVYPKEYLQRVAKLARRYNVHLILDEVATGFGRTGKMFALEYAENIRPDFLCLAKGITGGYLPLAATLTTDKIYKAFYADYAEKKTFYHGHTYTANPISCSAAVASLELFAKEGALSRARHMGELLRRSLESWRSLSLVGDVRSLGLIAGIELVKDKKTKERFGSKRRIGLEVYRLGLRNHLILRPLGDVIYLFLPLCIKENQLHEILYKIKRIIKSLRR